MSVIHKIRRKMFDKEYEFAIPHFFEEMTDDDPGFKDIERVLEKERIERRFTKDLRGTR